MIHLAPSLMWEDGQARSIFIRGMPGMGKTWTGMWIASQWFTQVRIPIIVIDFTGTYIGMTTPNEVTPRTPSPFTSTMLASFTPQELAHDMDAQDLSRYELTHLQVIPDRTALSPIGQVVATRVPTWITLSFILSDRASSPQAFQAIRNRHVSLLMIELERLYATGVRFGIVWDGVDAFIRDPAFKARLARFLAATPEAYRIFTSQQMDSLERHQIIIDKASPTIAEVLMVNVKKKGSDHRRVQGIPPPPMMIDGMIA